MCYNGKCMHCIDIETGSLIFAIFSITVKSLLILFTIGAMVYVNVMLPEAIHADMGPESMNTAITSFLMVNIVLGVVLCVILIPFAFTIVLIKGLVQKKPALVKVYIIFGLIFKSLTVIGALLGAVSGRYSLCHALAIFVGVLIYALILRMLLQTYKKLRVDAQFEKTKLVNEIEKY